MAMQSELQKILSLALIGQAPEILFWGVMHFISTSLENDSL